MSTTDTKAKLKRYRELLEVCAELLRRQEKAGYVLNVLDEEVRYDGAICDGHCLLEDIQIELDN